MGRTQDEGATWRDWTNLLARVRFGKQTVAGKTVSGLTVKAVGERMATYADRDGTRVRPGLARLAVDLETSYTTVRNAVTVLERVGLIQLITPATRTHAAVYRLVIPTSLLEREDVELWSPAQHTMAAKKLSETYRGRSPQAAIADASGVSDSPVDNCGNPAPPTDDDLPIADASGTEDLAIADASGTETLTPQGSATNHRPNHNYDQPTSGDQIAELAVPRARSPDDAADVPAKCPEPTCVGGVILVDSRVEYCPHCKPNVITFPDRKSA